MYKIMNQNTESTEILLYSLVEGGYTAARLIKALQANPSENVTLRINSDGGDTFEGITIYNYLKDRNVTVLIDGMCASAASIIAMAGKRIVMKQGSLMMIHNPITFAYGDNEELKNIAVMLDKVTDLMAGVYEARTGKGHEEILEMMKAQTWLTGPEALSYGFCDEIEEVPAKSEESTPPASQLLSYEDGIAAERKRLQALDELYTPTRASILNRAKYVTCENASEIAIELLKAERPAIERQSPERLTNFRGQSDTEAVINQMSEYINRRRS